MRRTSIWMTNGLPIVGLIGTPPAVAWLQEFAVAGVDGAMRGT